MAENRRGKENRFYFSRVQMLLMGVAFSLASLAIFLLGMFVGKGIEERKIAKKEEPLVKIPVAPEGGVSGTQAQKKDEITFNNSVAKAPTAPLVEEIAKEEKPAVKTAKTEIPAPKVERKTEKAAVETTSKQTETGSNAESTDQSKTWRVQVNAFPDDRSAKLLVDRLKNKGYNAYVSEVENAGKTWYRVSVGQYSTRKEADKVLEVLKTKEKFPKAFAASK